MKIGVLTSSRADYGIYLPLLKKLKHDVFFETQIIAFGTHLSEKHGYTLHQIERDGFVVDHKINTIPEGDNPVDISMAIGNTINNFSKFWENHAKSFDLVLCLGDRYEMFAAVVSSIPFHIRIAHIHGGETTLGAIDNIFRHSITLASDIHFTATETFSGRVFTLTEKNEDIYTVGALSLDNLNDLNLYSKEEFKEKFNIDLTVPPILVTFHPETISVEKNEHYTNELIAVLSDIKDPIVITMPNADTMGNMVREKLNQFIESDSNATGVESFGTLGYFSCIKHCKYLLGNTSSGIIEAASLKKYVINIGDRQKGRISGENVIHCPIDKKSIKEAISKVENRPPYSGYNMYGDGHASEQIIKILKEKIVA